MTRCDVTEGEAATMTGRLGALDDVGVRDLEGLLGVGPADGGRRLAVQEREIDLAPVNGRPDVGEPVPETGLPARPLDEAGAVDGTTWSTWPTALGDVVSAEVADPAPRARSPVG